MPLHCWRTLILVTLVLAAAATAAAEPVVHVARYAGPVTPLTAEYFHDRLAEAAAAAVDLIVIALDTPGGLDTAMRDIIKDIQASPVPVAVYVSPSGRRAASAGAFITVAAHVAAMAPGTNIGSASPVQMGGAAMDSTMAAKVSNDAASYIDALATQRGRNAELARRMVVEAANVTAQQALEQGLIDLVAPDLDSLLDELDGRTIEVAGEDVVLDLKDAAVEDRPMGARQRLLKELANPNVAYILMLLGIYGLFFELSNPGTLVPGILGSICLLLALYAFQALPVNYAGAALIVLGAILLVLEVKVPSFGGLTIGGLVALVLGSLLLFDSPEPWARISLRVMVPVLVCFSGFFVLCVWLVVRGQRRPPASGPESLVGECGRVVVAAAASALAKVVLHGEVWDAEAIVDLEESARVKVVEVRGRMLRVELDNVADD